MTMSSVIKGKVPDYANLLQDPEFGGIPSDVTFQIDDNSTVTEMQPDKRVKRLKRDKNANEIKAHKIILASSSSVFKAMFFGPMKESKDVIDVKETTFKAFKKLIEFIYLVDIECRDISLVELYDIVNLAERYDMPKLTEELKIQMENIPISMDNLIEVAATASEYSQFGEVSDALLMSCAKFLQETFRDPTDGLEFAQTQYASGNGEIAMKLLALVDVKQLTLVECVNCQRKPCLVGQAVPYAKMRFGLEMKMLGYYPSAQNYCHAPNTDVIVVDLLDSHGRVKVNGERADRRGRFNFTYNPAWEDNGVLKMTFVYNCWMDD